MSKKMVLVGLEANMLEILNNELVEYEPGSFQYEASLDAFERLLNYTMVVMALMDEEGNTPEGFNIFKDTDEIEKALREASKQIKKSSEEDDSDLDGENS